MPKIDLITLVEGANVILYIRMDGHDVVTERGRIVGRNGTERADQMIFVAVVVVVIRRCRRWWRRSPGFRLNNARFNTLRWRRWRRLDLRSNNIGRWSIHFGLHWSGSTVDVFILHHCHRLLFLQVSPDKLAQMQGQDFYLIAAVVLPVVDYEKKWNKICYYKYN